MKNIHPNKLFFCFIQSHLSKSSKIKVFAEDKNVMASFRYKPTFRIIHIGYREKSVLNSPHDEDDNLTISKVSFWKILKVEMVKIWPLSQAE